MTKESKLILVTGATGKQGGAVARHLLADGWPVRALTRDPAKPEARNLMALGAEVVKGDLSDRVSLDAALKGAYGCYSVQNFWETGYDLEILQGKNLAEAAKAAGVKHFVYSSVGGAERKTGLPHFESKWVIEQHISHIGLPNTVLRPVFFMDNFSAPNYRASILDGILTMPMPPNKPLAMLAVDDIGGFAALAFAHPEEYMGKAMELAGDELTIPAAASAFSRALGRTVRYVEMPIEEMRRVSEEYAWMFEWFIKEGYKVNLRALRDLYPGLTSFDDWLVKVDWVREQQPIGAGQKARGI